MAGTVEGNIVTSRARLEWDGMAGMVEGQAWQTHNPSSLSKSQGLLSIIPAIHEKDSSLTF